MIANNIPNMRLAVYPEKGAPYAVVAVDVAPEGIASIRSELLQHGPLSRRVAELFGTDGIAFAPMWEGTTSEYAKDFEHDSVGDRVAHKWLAEYATLRWGSACQVIFEEPIGEYKGFRARAGEYFGSEGYFYLIPHSGDLFKDLEGASGQTGFFRYGFMISPPVPLPPNGQMDIRTIESLTRNTRLAFMSAYESMSYVVWMK